MVTIRASCSARAIGIGLLMLLLGACSREQQDWRAAEGSDTAEAYDRFIQRHPDSELVSQARMRLAQLGEDSDWQHAGSADTVEAYRDFLQQHPTGKWSQEARIRIDNFSLSEQAGTDAGTRSAANGTADRGRPGVSAPISGSPSGALTAAAAPALPPAESTVTGVWGRTPVTPTAALPLPASPAPSASATPSTPSASSAPLASPAPSSGSFGIQLGAFTTEAGATAQWQALTTRFGPELQGLHQHVVPADTPSGRIYRLQSDVGPETRARSICESLRKQGQACVAVLPH
jgi:cell division septation protein DedD